MVVWALEPNDLSIYPSSAILIASLTPLFFSSALRRGVGVYDISFFLRIYTVLVVIIICRTLKKKKKKITINFVLT